MFYAAEILSRDGRLGHIWLAAHMDRKLTKTQIISVKISEAVGQILDPKDMGPFSLRTSGKLMLGIVKIYQRKAQYLLTDCSEAVLKINVFHQGNVNLPESVASVNSITIPEPEMRFTFRLPMDLSLTRGLDVTLGNVTQNVSMDISFRGRSQSTPSQPAVQERSLISEGFGFTMDEELLREDSIEQGRREEARRESLMESGTGLQPIAAGEEFGGFDITGFPDKADDFRPSDISLTEESRPTPATPATPLRNLLGTPDISMLGTPATPATASRKRRAEIVPDESTQLSKTEYKRWLQDPSNLLRPAPNPADIREVVVDLYATPAWLQRSLVSHARDLERFSRPFSFRPRIEQQQQQQQQQQEKPRKKRDREEEEEEEDKEQEQEASKKLKPDEPEREPLPAQDFGFGMDAGGGFGMDTSGFGMDLSGDSGTPAPQPAPAAAAAAATEGEKRETSREREREEEEEEEEEGRSAESVSSKHTLQILNFLKKEFTDRASESLSVRELLQSKKRAAAAGLFYELLVLKTRGIIHVEQEEPYEDITVHRTPNLDI